MPKNISFYLALLTALSINIDSYCATLPTAAYSRVQQSLERAQKLLNDEYNYNAAIISFNETIALYENNVSPNSCSQALAEQAYIGAAFAYHHIGNHQQRDLNMRKAQALLSIPENSDEYSPTMFADNAVGYYVLDGYRSYIHYENAHKNSEPSEHQEQHLVLAQKKFSKALEIGQALQSHLDEQAHAYQGLGTIFEFLSACKQAQQDSTRTLDYAHRSHEAFRQALSLRKNILGKNHLHVARSHHKLARSCVSLARLTNDKALPYQADKHYKIAIAIFEKNNISKDQVKRKELETEYELFKNKHKTNACCDQLS